MMNNILNFIVIDDDPINNKLCTIIIRQAFANAMVQTFNSPEDGLAFLQSLEASTDDFSFVLFLDINMPLMNGWEFLGHYEKLNENIKAKIRIFILSSSVNEEDVKHASQYKSVVNYIIKPLKKQVVFDIAHFYQEV